MFPVHLLLNADSSKFEKVPSLRAKVWDCRVFLDEVLQSVSDNMDCNQYVFIAETVQILLRKKMSPKLCSVPSMLKFF